jgi:hypothetical protein
MIGLGGMRLSTTEPRDEARAVAVIHAALDAGATLLDTADAYCLDEHDTGHNERLIASALRTWPGDASRITVATKGGLTRPRGRWVPDGRGKHLRQACLASLAALGVPAINLYQLHAVDPRVPLETIVRALAALQREQRIRRIGLSNVTLHQIQSAQRLAEIAAVQVSLSVFDDENLRNGVVAMPELDTGLAGGHLHWVLDNTYPSRASRSRVIECASRHGVGVRCIRLTTSLADAQINAVCRLIEAYGRLPMPEDLREHHRLDHRFFGPDAQFRYERKLEPPALDEGFSTVEDRGFVRQRCAGFAASAIVFAYDDVLCASAGGASVALTPDDVVLPVSVKPLLERHFIDGMKLFAIAWRPQIRPRHDQ